MPYAVAGLAKLVRNLQKTWFHSHIGLDHIHKGQSLIELHPKLRRESFLVN